MSAEIPDRTLWTSEHINKLLDEFNFREMLTVVRRLPDGWRPKSTDELREHARRLIDIALGSYLRDGKRCRIRGAYIEAYVDYFEVGLSFVVTQWTVEAPEFDLQYAPDVADNDAVPA